MRKSVKKKTFLVYRKILLVSISCLALFFLGLIFWGPLPSYPESFKTLDDVVAYAKSTDEFVSMDNKDFLKPSYESYYKKKFETGFLKRVAHRIRGLLVTCGILKAPAFSFEGLQKLLADVAKFRSDAGFKGNFVQRTLVEPQSQFIVVGVLQGAFHSFVRTLSKLQEMGKLTKNLEFTDPKIIMVLLGNVVNRSPYTSETLALVLRLLKNNPRQVIYCRGTNEFDFYWVQHTLRRELELGARFLSKEEIPLFKEVSAFFATLPLELYGIMQYKSSEKELPYIAFSAFVEDKKLAEKIKENLYPKFLEGVGDGGSDILDLENFNKEVMIVASQQIVLKASIRDIRKRDSFEKMDGLRSLPPENDALVWTILSCPTASYRNGLKFMYDAFGLISGGKDFDDWKLTLYNRHVESKLSTFGSREVKLMSPDKDKHKDKSKKSEQNDSVIPSASKKQDKHKSLVELSSVTDAKVNSSTNSVATHSLGVSSARVSPEQIAFYRELISQVGSLKREVADVRASILKELQKFENSTTADKQLPLATEKKQDIPLVQQSPQDSHNKKEVLNQANKAGTKLEESIDKVLNELKEQRKAVTIHNHLGAQSTQEKTEAEKITDSKGLVAIVHAMQEELRLQREFIHRALMQGHK